LYVEWADRPTTTVFKVRKVYSRAAVARQLKDVEATQHAREGNRVVTVVFEVIEASSRLARELENIEATWCKAEAAWELEEGYRVTIVFEIGDASSRVAQGVLCLTISST
jgi:hypothetical protein